MNAVNPTPLLMIIALSTTVAVSGCIDPDDFEAWYESESHEHDWHEEWGDDCLEPHPPSGPAAADEGGDVSSGTVKGAYPDAQPRFHNHVDGEEDSLRTIDVPLGTDELIVGLVYDLDGEYTLRLRNPLGMTVAVENFDGRKEMREDEWVLQDRPMPGAWKLSIDIEGHGGYTFGFYLDD